MFPAESTAYSLCVAFLRIGSHTRFLYGYAVACKPRAGWRANAEITVGEDVQLQLIEIVVHQASMNEISTGLAEGSLNFSSLFQIAADSVSFLAERTTLESGFGHTRVPTTRWVSDWQWDFNQGSPEVLVAILKVLASHTGLPFTSSHADRLGSFEWFRLGIWLEESPPYSIEPVSGHGQDGSEGYMGHEVRSICRK